jgi:hypothetical protein
MGPFRHSRLEACAMCAAKFSSLTTVADITAITNPTIVAAAPITVVAKARKLLSKHSGAQLAKKCALENINMHDQLLQNITNTETHAVMRMVACPLAFTSSMFAH